MGTRQQHSELMEVEFIGGPFDGSRLVLRIVRVGERDICVLRRTYEPMFPVAKASEVEARDPKTAGLTHPEDPMK